jgi:hypothetical protein
LLGYDSNTKAYRVFNKSLGFVEVTSDIVFVDTNGSPREQVDLLSESGSPTGWRSAPALSPEMRRGLGGSLDCWRGVGTHKNIQGLEWFGPLERNTLLHCEVYCLGACMS